jgi:filamentous hemagglutinin
MNKGIFRLVFNATCGQPVAVAEIASSQSKTPGGRVHVAVASSRPRSLAVAVSAIQMGVFIALGWVYLLSPVGSYTAMAQTLAPTVSNIVADPNAPRTQQATVLTAANGVAQVNIQTPSAMGVSRNTYSSFDVGSQGAILNNSRTNVQTQLGGWVQANPWLATGPARVILNEVNSASPSQLRGFVEVAGQRAEVIIANPAGIQVNGAGFINASGVVLSTGQAQMNGGSLDSMQVRSGTVEVSGAGLDTRDADYTAILARAVSINANVWANHLQVTTGANEIALNNAVINTQGRDPVTPIAPEGAAPSYALDVGALGGMYAGKIFLVGTEAGLGVRNAGRIETSSGPLMLSQDGWIANSGSMLSAQKLQITSLGSTSNTGTVHAGAALVIQSQASQEHQGTTAAVGSVTLQAQGSSQASIRSGDQSLIASGMDADGQLVGAQKLNIQAQGQVQLSGQTRTADLLTLQGDSVDLSQGKLSANQASITALQGDILANGSDIAVAANLGLSTQQALRTDAARIVTDSLSLQAASWSNVGGSLLHTGAQDLSISLQGNLDNSAGVLQTNSRNLTITADTLLNQDGDIAHIGSGALVIGVRQLENLGVTAATAADGIGSRIATNGSLSISASNTLTNAGTLSAKGDMQVQAATLSNSVAILAAGAMTTTAGDITNTATGIMHAGTSQTITASNTLTNQGQISAGGDSTINAATFNNQAGALILSGADLRTTATSLNNQGAMLALGAQSISTTTLSAGASSLIAAGMDSQGTLAAKAQSSTALAITASGSMQSAGKVLAYGDVSIQGASIDLQSSSNNAVSTTGSVAGNLSLLATQGDINTSKATISSAAGQTSLQANAQSSQSLINQGGTISSNTLRVRLSQLDNSAQGKITQTSTQALEIDLGAGNLNNATGQLVSAGQLTIKAAKLDNSEGALGSQEGALAVTTRAGGIDNRKGLLQAGSDISLSAQGANTAIDNTQGRIIAARNLASNSGALDNTQGLISAVGTLSLQTNGQRLSNLNGEIKNVGTGVLRITAGSIDNLAPTILVDAIATGSRIVGNGKLELTASNTLTNAGMLSAKGDMQVQAASLSNSAIIVTSGAITTTADNITNTASGLMQAGTTQAITASDTLTNQGRIYAGTDSSIQAATLANSATIVAAGAMNTTASNIANNSTGLMHAGTTQVITASNTLTNQGQISAGGDSSINAATFNNQAGALLLSGADLHTTTTSLNNQGAMLALGAQSISTTTLSAGASSLIAAGMDSQGALAAKAQSTTALAITASGSMQSAGKLLAYGDLSIQGASIDLQGSNNAVSTVGSVAGNLSLRATQGDINTSKATISSAAGQTSVQANASSSQSLINQGGSISAKTLSLKLGQLDNSAQGKITQTSDQALEIDLGAGTLNNASGQLVSAGKLTIKAAKLDNSEGALGSQEGALAVTTSGGGIDNRKGLLQAGSDISISAQGANTAINNQEGRIIAARNLSSNSGALDNTQGLISAVGTLSLQTNGQRLSNADTKDVQDPLNPQAGQAATPQSQRKGLLAGSSIDLQTGEIINTAGQIQALSDITVQTNGLRIDNTAGRFIAGQDLGLSSGSIGNANGLLYAKRHLAMTINAPAAPTTIALNNAGGTVIASTGDITLSSTQGSLQNTNGLVQAARDLSLTLQGSKHQINNTNAGQLIAGRKLSSNSGAVDNTGGLISAGTDLSLDTNNATLTNASTLDGDKRFGLQAGGAATLLSGALDNRSGYINAAGLTVTASSVSNQGGTAISNASSTLTTGSLDNQGGQWLSVGDMRIDADTIDNSGQGNIRTAADLLIKSDGTINNAGGIVSAAGVLTIAPRTASTPTLQIDNAAGSIKAEAAVDINTAKLSGAGTVAAGTDLTVRMQGDYSTLGIFSAGRDMLLSMTGNYTNNLALNAGRNLSITAVNIDNQGDGQLLSKGITTLTATQDFTNRGLVDGSTTRIQANIVTNLGTGRIYGDSIGIGAQALTNKEETIGGITKAASIAARTRLDIGAQTIVNQEHALIYSDGDMAIGGALDANWRATGRAQSLLNASATIEAANDLSLATGVLTNKNLRVTLTRPSVDTRIADYSVQSTLPNADSRDMFYYTNLKETVTTDTVTTSDSDRAKIVAGRNLALSVTNGTNYFSHVITGGTLAINLQSNNITNNEPTLYKTTVVSGTQAHKWVRYTGGWWGHDEWHWDESPYQSNPIITVIPVTQTYQSLPVQIPSQSQVTVIGAIANQPSTTPKTTGTNAPAQASDVGVVQGQTMPDGSNAAPGQTQAPAAKTADTSQAQANTASASDSALTANGSSAPGQAQAPAVKVADSANAVSSTANTSDSKLQATTTKAPNQAPSPSAKQTQAPVLMQVRTSTLPTRIPNTSLYRILPQNTSNYLVETDPQFTQLKTWLGSDYLLKSVALDPAITQKRLGDGYYEQKLIREQVAQLTGRRFLGDYSNDQAQYQALMDNALTTAKALKLRPGIALSAEQMALLTSDIVWMVEQSITLADGSVQKVLVPQLYVRVKEGDLDGSGSLISGDSINMNLSGDLNNSGTIASRKAMSITADNIKNLGGTMSADQLGLTARQDIDNIGGTLAALSSATLDAGRDVNISSTTQSSSVDLGTFKASQTSVDRVAAIYVKNPGGSLNITAKNNINLTAAKVDSQGSANLKAGNDINLNTLTTSQSQDITIDADNYRRSASSKDIGSSITAANKLSLDAGNDINAKAANVQAGGALDVKAKRDINIVAGEDKQSSESASKTSSSSWFSSSTTVRQDSSSANTAIGSSFSGNSVSLDAGRDLGLKGSRVLGDQDISITANNNITIEAAQNTASQNSYSKTSQSGLFSSGGGLLLGSSSQSTDAKAGTTSAAASTIGSTGGNITTKAGNAVKQTGSDVVALAGDVNIQGKTVKLNEQQESSTMQVQTQSEQSGLSLGASGGAISAAQTVDRLANAAANSSDPRMKALAAGAAALAAKEALSNPTPSISLSLGSSESSSTSNTQTSSARGSTVTGGGTVSISASGAGKASDITVQDSTVSGKTTVLDSEGKVNLLASQNTSSQTNSQSSKSASIGLTLGATGAGITLSANQSSGDGSGQDTSYNNTRVQGNSVTIKSADDTNLKGAVVAGNSVKTDIGGNLNVESLQDTSSFAQSSKNIGGSVTFSPVGVPTGGSISLGKSNIDSNYTSVNEQSGIRAGDGGFQVDVKGKTDLKGGAITSTQVAIDNKANTYEAKQGTTLTDLSNSADYKADGFQVSAGVGTAKGGSAGVGSDKGNVSSTTQAAISGVAGNKDARTGDKESGIAKIFDADKVTKDVNAQVTIIGEFGKRAAKEVGDYAGKKLTDLKKQASNESDPTKKAALLADAAKWEEGGAYRVALHTAVGGLTGGVQGAVGAATSQTAVPVLGDALKEANLPVELKEALILAAGTAVGAATGGTAGVGAGLNATGNNYLYSYKGKIIAVDKNDNNKVIDLSDSDKQKLAAKEPAVLMKEIAGIDADSAPVVVSNERAKEMTSSTTYDLTNPKDRNQLQGQTDMGYIVTDTNTRIYVQTGMQTKPEDALKNAQALSQIVKEPVGVIVNGTQGLPKDVEEYLPKAPNVKDALNEYTYQTLNKNSPSLVVLHSAGNEDAKKALQLGQQLGHQYSNLSFLSLASPNSDSVMRSTTTNTNANYLGQINDWRDPVTNPKLWVAGTGALAIGGLVGGVVLAPATGGGSLYAYGSALIGGGIGGGAIVTGINTIHPLDNYLAKPQTQSIMFDWKAKQKK